MDSGQEEEVLHEIAKQWPSGTENISEQLLSLLNDSVERCPLSSRLWYWRGIGIQRWDGTPQYVVNDYILCFDKAIYYDPLFSDAYEEKAYVLYTYDDDIIQAEQCFRRAIELGAGENSYIGLARLIAFRSVSEALGVLDAPFCPFLNSLSVIEARRELLSAR